MALANRLSIANGVFSSSGMSFLQNKPEQDEDKGGHKLPDGNAGDLALRPVGEMLR